MATYAAGDFVKAEFSDDKTGESEWMWVRVERCDDENRLLFGRLDSQPVVFAGELKLGQEIAVSFDRVRDHKKPQDF